MDKFVANIFLGPVTYSTYGQRCHTLSLLLSQNCRDFADRHHPCQDRNRPNLEVPRCHVLNSFRS
jgi:hypothetical protein